jgi:hypothetical protein
MIPITKPLANQLRLLAGRLGVSVPNITEEAIKQVIRADTLNTTVKDAVDALHMAQIHRGAGLINFQRNAFKDLIKHLYNENPDELLDLWHNSGSWYAAYLSTKINSDFFNFFERDLLVSWNLDEAEIKVEDVAVYVRLTSFGMSHDITGLLVMYTKGFFKELGYQVTNEDILPGLISFRFLMKTKHN